MVARHVRRCSRGEGVGCESTLSQVDVRIHLQAVFDRVRQVTAPLIVVASSTASVEVAGASSAGRAWEQQQGQPQGQQGEQQQPCIAGTDH